MNQFTAIYNGNGELINNIKYYDGFMGQRVGAISCLAFHPHWVCVPHQGWGMWEETGDMGGWQQGTVVLKPGPPRVVPGTSWNTIFSGPQSLQGSWPPHCVHSRSSTNSLSLQGKWAVQTRRVIAPPVPSPSAPAPLAPLEKPSRESLLGNHPLCSLRESSPDPCATVPVLSYGRSTWLWAVGF